MNKNNEIYDVSAELAKEFGEVGTKEREEAVTQAWEEYNAHILLDARKNARLTQEELAKRIGANKSYISRVEKGTIVPSIATFYRIVNALGLSVELVPA